MRADDDILLVACSVFRPELEALQAAGRLRMPVDYHDSSLHMRPAQLAAALDEVVAVARQDGRRCLFCYGDCDPDMHLRCDGSTAVRPCCGNCVELLVGKQRRRQWMQERAFVLLPEWTARWRELLLRLPGLDVEQTRALFHEQHDMLIYADTGVLPVPEGALQACAAHFDLPLRIEAVDLDGLAQRLEASLTELDSHA